MMGEIAEAMIEAEMNGYAAEDYVDYLLEGHFKERSSRYLIQ